MLPSSTASDRPKAYFNIDGLGELGLAIFCLGGALIGYLRLHNASLLVLAAALELGIRTVKARFTYPRTGFVEYRKRDTVWMPILVAAPLAALLAVAITLAVRGQWRPHTIAVLLGALFTASYSYGFARTVRWKWIVAILMGLATVIFALLPAGQFQSVAEGVLACMATYGSLLVVSGATTLIQYVRHTSPPNTAE